MPPSATSSTRDYFDAVLSFERSWLVAARREGELGAAAIAAVSDGVLHYYLGGTADRARDASPFKNVVVAMLDLADELELPLNLGGGLVAGDGLEAFKRGFTNAELAFSTHEIVCDPDVYAELAGDRDAGGLLPRLPGLAERADFGVTPPPGGSVTPPKRSIRAWIRLRICGIIAASTSPGHAVRPTVPWPNTLLRRTRRPAG